MGELEEKVERIEKVLLLTWKLAKAVKRAHNQVTRTFNGNFDVFEDKVGRNANNIDKIVKTLQGLVGDAAEWDKENPEGKIANKDIEMMFL
jgi:hypothetical protein